MTRWRRVATGVLLLTALVVAPVSEALCAVRCAPAADHPVQDAVATRALRATAHPDCHGPSLSSTAQLSAASDHACGDHARIAEEAAASLLPGRDDTSLVLHSEAHTVSALASDLGQLAQPPPLVASQILRPLFAPPALAHRALVLRI